MKLILNSDGGSRGNPGPAACAAVIHDNKGNKVGEYGVFIGHATNNEAEYKGLILGLEKSLELAKGEPLDLDCYLDSELVVKQLNGQYKVKNENIKIFVGKIHLLEKSFHSISYNHVLRGKNQEADALLNQVLDSQR